MFSFAALANGSTQILRFHENDLIIRKNSDNIFCYKNDELLCTFNCKKSNKNISDFVQAMQKINIDIISLYNYPNIEQTDIDFE